MRRLTVVTKVKPENLREFLQTMDSLRSGTAVAACGGRITVHWDDHEPTLFNLTFEWQGDQDFEDCFEAEGFRIFLGAVRVLCEEPQFLCNFPSEEWTRLVGAYRERLRMQPAEEKSGAPEVRQEG